MATGPPRRGTGRLGRLPADGVPRGPGAPGVSGGAAEFGIGPAIGRGLADVLGGEGEPAQRDLPDERFGPGGDVVHAILHGGLHRRGGDGALRPPRACPRPGSSPAPDGIAAGSGCADPKGICEARLGRRAVQGRQARPARPERCRGGGGSRPPVSQGVPRSLRVGFDGRSKRRQDRIARLMRMSTATRKTEGYAQEWK